MTTTGTWQQELAAFRAWMTAAGRSPGTVRMYSHYVRGLSATVSEPWSATLDELVAFLARPDWGAETRASARTALRSFYRWAMTTGRVTVDPAARLPTVPRPAGQPRPAPLAAVEKALEQASARDRLMVLLAVTGGLRRSEIARVHSRDLVEGTLRVRGKGGKVRPVPLRNVELLDAIAGAGGYLFPGDDNGHLSPDRVGKVVARLLGGGWTAHTLRHRFATEGYAAQRDILAMQQLLGHSKPETTARYAAVPLDALDSAVAAAAAPFGDSIGATNVVELATRRAAKSTGKPTTPAAPSRRLQGDGHRLRAVVDKAIGDAESSATQVWLLMLLRDITLREIESMRRGDYIGDERTLLIGGRRARVAPVDTTLAAALNLFITRTDGQIGQQGRADPMFRFLEPTGLPINAPWMRSHLAAELRRAGYRGNALSAVDRLRTLGP